MDTSKLPVWARNYITALEQRSEPDKIEMRRLHKEIRELRLKLRRKEDEIEAMVHFFKCAAKGENEIAKAVSQIVYEFLPSGD